MKYWKYWKLLKSVPARIEQIRMDGKITVDEVINLVQFIFAELGIDNVVLIDEKGGEKKL